MRSRVAQFAQPIAWVLALGTATLVGCGSDASSPASSSSSGGSSGTAGSAGTAGAGGSSAGSAGEGGTTSGGSGGSSTSGGSAGTAGTAGTGGTGGTGPQVLCPPDEDGDNIPDEIEGKDENIDTDGDNTPDWQDTDSDNDSIPDRIEADTANVGCNTPLDSDGDQIPNHLDTDSDNNGIDDIDEVYPNGDPYDPGTPISDVDGDGIPDAFDPDNDGDDLTDIVEIGAGGDADTDGDGIPDFDELDADDDGIADGFEGIGNADSDMLPNFQDLDSDSDGIPDSCERGFGHMIENPPADSDQDGRFDAYDVDSDNDGIKDGLEDTNSDCTFNQGETDRTKADTDEDGANDLIELSLGSDPTNQNETPQSLGKYYFVIPFMEPPQPTEQNVVLATNLNKGDIAFLIDATGSMGPAINNIKNNLTDLVTSIQSEAPEARFGVLGVQDFPVNGHGSATNVPVFVPLEPDSYLTDNIADTQDALEALTTDNGQDLPEAMVPAMFKALENNTMTWPSGGFQAPFAAGGGYGALGFRDDALPVLVLITDAPFHNGREMMCDVGLNDPCKQGCCAEVASTLHDTYGFSAADADQVLTKLTERGAKVVGIALGPGGAGRFGAPYRDMAFFTDGTNSVVLPSVFGGGQCPTDNFQLNIAPDGPELIPGLKTCRLIFGAPADGSGTKEAVKQGVLSLLQGISLSVRVRARPIQSDPNFLPVDALNNFVNRIEVQVGQRVPDPTSDSGEFCDLRALPADQIDDLWGNVYGTLPGADGYDETVKDIQPGLVDRVCFRVVAKQNNIITQTDEVQIAKATLSVLATPEGETDELVVGSPRDVLFIVPPVLQ